MADFSITGEVRLNSDPAEKSLSSWTVAAGNLISDLAKTAASQLEGIVQSALEGGAALEQSIGGVETLFKKSASTVKANADEAYRTAGLSANSYMELATSFAASLLSSLGNDTEEAARVADMAMVDMSDNANKMGTDMQSIQNAYQGFAKQNYTMLDNLKLGYGGTKEEMKRLLEDAEKFSGVHYDISNLSDVYKAIHVIQEELDITGTTAEEASSTISGSAAAMKASWENLISKLTLGEDLKPSLESLVTTTKTYLIDNLLPAVGNIVGGIPEIIVSLLPEFVGTGFQLINGIGQGVTDGIPDFIAKALPLLSDFAGGLRENAGKLVDAGIDLVLSLMQGLMDGLPTLIQYLPGIVSNLAGIITDNAPKLLSAGVQLIVMLGEGLLKAVPALIENIPQICKAIFDVFTAFRWLDIGGYIIDGMWNGLKSGWTGLVSKVQGLAQQLPDIVKKVLGIHSPSKVFSEIGMQTCAGLAEGLADGNTKVKDAAKTVVASVTDTATEIIDGVTKTTQTVTETMLNGATQQKQVITETGKQIIDGTEKTVKKVTTIAADGSTTVTQTMEDTKATVVSTVKDTKIAIVDGVQTTVETTTKTLSDGSEQVETITTKTGREVIDGVERTVKTVTTTTADGVETCVKTIEDSGVQFSSSGEMVVTQLDDALNDAWTSVNSSIQTDVFGSIQTLIKAIEDGDLASVAKWTAGIFYGSLTNEQQKQIQSFAISAANQLTESLSGVFTNLATLAAGFVGQFVPATEAAATAQGILNTVLEANPILAVISVVGLLVAAFVGLAKTNKDVGNAVKDVWQGVQDFMSVIFEGLLRIVAAGIQGFVSLINGLIDAYNLVAQLWNGKIDHIDNPAASYADKIKSDREKRQAERAAQAAAEREQAELDKKYAEESGEAEKKQLEAQYRKKQADLEKAKLSTDSPEMLEAEKKVALAEYEKSLADLEKKLLDAEYSKASAEIEKKTTTDETKLAELEKKITEAENTIKTADLEKQLLKVDYENDLKTLEAKYAKTATDKNKIESKTVTKSIIDSVTDTTKKQNADGSETTIKTVTDTIKDSTGKIYQQVTKTITETGTKLVDGVEKTYTKTTTLVDGVQQKVETVLSDVQKKAETDAKPDMSKPSTSSSDDTAKKLADLKSSYDKKLTDLKADFTEKQKAIEEAYSQKLTQRDEQYQKKLDSLKSSYDKQLSSVKSDYDRKIASLEKEQDNKNSQYQTKLDQAKSDYNRQIEQLKKDYDWKLANLEKEQDKKEPASSPDLSGPDPTPAPPDTSHDDLTDAVIDNTEAILSTNRTLTEMVKKANTLVLSDNMRISNKVAASGTAQIAAAANVYNSRSGDTIVQNIYSKAQDAADLARETRWEADRAKAQKY